MNEAQVIAATAADFIDTVPHPSRRVRTTLKLSVLLPEQTWAGPTGSTRRDCLGETRSQQGLPGGSED